MVKSFRSGLVGGVVGARIFKFNDAVALSMFMIFNDRISTPLGNKREFITIADVAFICLT